MNKSKRFVAVMTALLVGLGVQAHGEVFIVEEADDPGFSAEALNPASTPVLNLVEGFNLVSWNVDPPDNRIDVLMAPIVSNLIQVLTFENIAVNPNPTGGVGAKLYDPSVDIVFSTLQSADYQLGYWIKMSAPDVLTISGAAIDRTTNRALDDGFNLVGYQPADNDLTTSAVFSTGASLVQVLGFETALNNPNSPGLGGKLYDPALPSFINTLKVMAPGLGYWVKVEGATPLNYPATPDPATPVAKVVASAAADEHVYPTNQWMGIYGQLLTDGESAPSGTVVDVVDEAGHIAAWAEVHHEGAYGYLPIYLDDPTSARDEGADVGEWLTVRVDGEPTKYRVQWTEFGDLVNLDMEVKSASASGLPQEFALRQNYPNPFNPATTITYQLPSEEAVSLSVYNPAGQKIRQLVRDVQQAGVHSVLWDGRDDAQISVASGYYFYRLEAGDFQQTQKLLLLK